MVVGSGRSLHGHGYPDCHAFGNCQPGGPMPPRTMSPDGASGSNSWGQGTSWPSPGRRLHRCAHRSHHDLPGSDPGRERRPGLRCGAGRRELTMNFKKTAERGPAYQEPSACPAFGYVLHHGHYHHSVQRPGHGLVRHPHPDLLQCAHFPAAQGDPRQHPDCGLCGDHLRLCHHGGSAAAGLSPRPVRGGWACSFPSLW